MFLLSACSWALLCCRPFLTNWVISWPHHGLGFALPNHYSCYLHCLPRYSSDHPWEPASEI